MCQVSHIKMHVELAFAVNQLVQLLAQKRRAVMRKHVNVQSCVEGHVSRWPAAVDDLCRNLIPEVLPTFMRKTAAVMLRHIGTCYSKRLHYLYCSFFGNCVYVMCNSGMCTYDRDCTFKIVNSDLLLFTKIYTEFQSKAAPLKIVGVQSFIGLRHSCRPPGALNVWTRKDDMWEKQVR